MKILSPHFFDFFLNPFSAFLKERIQKTGFTSLNISSVNFDLALAIRDRFKIQPSEIVLNSNFPLEIFNLNDDDLLLYFYRNKIDLIANTKDNKEPKKINVLINLAYRDDNNLASNYDSLLNDLTMFQEMKNERTSGFYLLLWITKSNMLNLDYSFYHEFDLPQGFKPNFNRFNFSLSSYIRQQIPIRIEQLRQQGRGPDDISFLINDYFLDRYENIDFTTRGYVCYCKELFEKGNRTPFYLIGFWIFD